MARSRPARRPQARPGTPSTLAKLPSGIQGLDDVTGGGLPRGRTTLVCGGPGCGKTILALEFLVRGAVEHAEPGVMLAFEETPEELAANVRSLGFDLDDLVRRGLLAVDYLRVDRHEIEETGEYDLEGLFIRLGLAIDQVGARRVALDTIESLFSGLSNALVLRSELVRLFRWLKDRGVTAIVTGERGEGSLTRHGLEEYVSDCVILLDHRVDDQIATRRMRVVKYRGTRHGTNEYPFVIEERGIEVLPITSVRLAHAAPDEHVSTGIPDLDSMMGSGGPFRGSTVMISGAAGTGKTTFGAHFVDAACRRGERALYLAFEESQDQLVRNMRSVGLDLGRWIRKGLLVVHAARPTLYGVETHLAAIHRHVRDQRPAAVVVDPVSDFLTLGRSIEVKSMVLRLVDHLKEQTVTAYFLTLSLEEENESEIGLSSLIDSWIVLRNEESGGERNRILTVVKSRGMSHSNQLREFRLTREGVRLSEPNLGPDGALTGSARAAQEARVEASARRRKDDIAGLETLLQARRLALEAQIESLKSEFRSEEDRVRREIELSRDVEAEAARDRGRMASSRGRRRS